MHRALRQLPQRRAPSSLEGRVWSELTRLASLPWWRRSFLHWPVAARASFFVLSAGLCALTFTGSARVFAGFGVVGRLADSLTWLRTAAEALGSLLRVVPSIWIYEALAAGALLYALLFALGAAAYRTLYLEA
ncbi:MAG: hypothetical protein WB646_10665 [Steroidobacteraceae bacterium]